MRASELIKQIEERINEHGDCEVALRDYDFSEDSSYGYNPIVGTYHKQVLLKSFNVQHDLIVISDK